MNTTSKYCILLILFILSCCKKEPTNLKTTINGLSDVVVKYGSILTISGSNFNILEGATKVLITDSLITYTITPLSVSKGEIKIEIYNHDDSTALLKLASFYVGVKTGTTTVWSDKRVYIISSWTQVSDFSVPARYMSTAFTLGGNCYIGGGAGDGGIFKDLWKYNPILNSWTRQADLPGPPRVYPRSFSNSINGFLGSGYSSDNSSRIQFYDFYKYDPQKNEWSTIPNYPDNISSFYVGYTLTVNGRPFISLSNQTLTMRELVNDSWMSFATVPDMIDCPASGVFSIGKKFYVVVGNRINNSVSNAVLEYNTDNGTWTKKANFPGQARYAPAFFSIGSFGYYGCGMSTSSEQHKDMWRYDPLNDKWIRIEDFPGGIRSHLIGVSDGKSGFVGLGIIMSSKYYHNDFWRYDP